MNFGEKKREGGMFSTPLLGHGDCEGLIFTNICGMGSDNGTFVAIDRASGKIVSRTRLQFYAWSSPVALYTPEKEMFVVTGDVVGNLYLIEAKSGKIIKTFKGGNNFESSPIVVDNYIVVGSRGREIHKFEIY
jgi:outer membrane protein assembly factor BamB